MNHDRSERRRGRAALLFSESLATTPTLDVERQLWSLGVRLVAGVDEAGRGCVAGPVVAAACILPVDVGEIPGVRDSKLLTAAQRGRLVDEIRRRAVAIGIGAASRREIDRLNIRVASVMAMRRALARVGGWEHAVYDGLPAPELDAEQTTAIVHGDMVCLSIACASIVAKVARDRLMARIARRYPEYGWERNAGYGTAEHLTALHDLGPTPHHRLSFAPVRNLRAPEPRALNALCNLEAGEA